MSKSCGGIRRNRYFHGPLRFIARASCLLRIRIDFVWEEQVAFCRKDGNSERYLFAFVPNTKPVLSYSHSLSVFLCATGYKSFPNIGLTYRFENSAARKQPICIRIMWNVPRDVRLLDASACLTTTGAARRKRSDPARSGNTSGERGAVTTTAVSLREVEVSLVALLSCKSKVWSRNWLMPMQLSILICLWLIKISERPYDLSCFRLQVFGSSTRVISLIYYRYWTMLKCKREAIFEIWIERSERI